MMDDATIDRKLRNKLLRSLLLLKHQESERLAFYYEARTSKKLRSAPLNKPTLAKKHKFYEMLAAKKQTLAREEDQFMTLYGVQSAHSDSLNPDSLKV